MRISDWSSDVCSSDLQRRIEQLALLRGAARHLDAVEQIGPFAARGGVDAIEIPARHLVAQPLLGLFVAGAVPALPQQLLAPRRLEGYVAAGIAARDPALPGIDTAVSDSPARVGGVLGTGVLVRCDISGVRIIKTKKQ